MLAGVQVKATRGTGADALVCTLASPVSLVSSVAYGIAVPKVAMLTKSIMHSYLQRAYDALDQQLIKLGCATLSKTGLLLLAWPSVAHRARIAKGHYCSIVT